jgi:asparagine synthase (glutamine-hydrolysing)
MCGIAGFWRLGGLRREDPDALARMTDVIRHRGPDDAGHWSDPAAGIALGHRRLSILDLSPEGHQPMSSAGGRYVIVFNGEIYNFRQLRGELEGAGAGFRGHSDTEVMLAAIDRWGLRGAVDRFAGMFAFALWDREADALHLVRDRLGEKPLYSGWMGDVFLFGSELKALRAHPGWDGRIDRGVVALFLRHAYVPQPWSIYEGIRKVPPGTIQTLRRPKPGAEPAEERYWSARAIAEDGAAAPSRLPDGEAIETFDALLRGTIRDEMVADVPLGAFLSGGVDSSTIVALMQAQSGRPVRTFTIGFHEDAFNEAHHARAVASHLGTDHTELYLTPGETLAVIPRLPALYDEPFADPSQIPTFLVSALARRSVTVSLSGDGGDELLGGYDRYAISDAVWRRMGRLPHAMRRPLGSALTALSPARWDRLLSLGGMASPSGRFSGERVHKLAGLLSLDTAEAVYRRMLSHWAAPERIVPGAVEPPVTLSDARQWPRLESYLQRMMYLDLVTYLPDDILVKVDRASMAVSLESRAPLLDHRIVEFTLRLPLAQKVRDGQGKWLLRQVLDRYVPRALTERPKMGFGVPIDRWLRGPLREWADDLLDEGRLTREGFFAPAEVTRTWREHLSGTRNWQFLLWDVLMFQAWLAAEPVPAAPPAPLARTR